MQRVRLPVLAFAVLVFAAFIGGSIAAIAQVDPTTTTAPPTSTSAPPKPTTTTTKPVVLPTTTTVTTKPPPSSSTSTTKPGPTTTTTTPEAPHVVPPEYIPMINGVKRSKPNNSGALIDALAPLRDFGLSEDQIAAAGFGHFPVAGYASFSDDWWTPRFTPTFHLHQGTDIFAAQGTPVRAPVDGVLRQSSEAVGGISVYVTVPDGTFYYGAHLSALVDDQKSGQRVKQGDIIGYVGNTGDAAGGASHLHFEIHPKGGAATDPKPFLDDWLKQAIDNVPTVIGAQQSNRPQAVVATVLTRELTEGGGGGVFAAQTSPPRSQLLWATAANPSAGAVHLALAEAAAAARDAGWSTLTRDEAARVHEWQAADNAARTVLAPFTPRALWTVLGYNSVGS